MKVSMTLLALLLALLVGCSSQPRRIDCEGHLRPINPPASVTTGSTHP